MTSPCLGCNAIETTPVTLRTGEVVCSSCDAWRHECEARAVIGMRGADRVAHLLKVQSQRGKEAADRLAQEVREIRSTVRGSR